MRRKKATNQDIKGFELLQEWKKGHQGNTSIESLKTLPNEFYVEVVIKIKDYRLENTWIDHKNILEEYLKENGIKFRTPSTNSCKWNSDWNYRAIVYKVRANQLNDFLKLMLPNETLEKISFQEDFRGFKKSTLDNPLHKWFGDVVKNFFQNLDRALNSTSPYYGMVRLDNDANYGNFRY